MIDIASAIPTTLSKLKKLPTDSTLTLLTFKRDRWIAIRKMDSDTYAITEHGFENQEFTSHHKGMKKLLKTLLKREFPRSNKVRVRVD